MTAYQRDDHAGDGPAIHLSRAMRRAAARMARNGGVILARPGDNKSTKVRNVLTGRVLPCCYSDCDEDGNVGIDYRADHEQPRWRDPKTGRQEQVVYIFCSPEHKQFYIRDFAQRR